MPTPSSGTDRSATMFRDQRLAQAHAPSRAKEALNIALGEIEMMDEHDSELHQLALVIYHCTRAVCTALDSRI